jgi:hypothetical protein
VPDLTPAPAPTPRPHREASIQLFGVGYTAATADAHTVAPGAELRAWGPLPLGDGAPFDVGVAVRLLAQPSAQFNPTAPAPDLSLVKSASLTLYASRDVGRYGSITSSIVGLWGVSGALPQEDAVVDRYFRRFGGGIRVLHENGAQALFAYGRDQSLGEFGKGQWMFEGSVPVAADGVLTLGMNASFSVGGTAETSHNMFTVWFGSDLVELVRRVKQ